jgi:hypothetical protein
MRWLSHGDHHEPDHRSLYPVAAQNCSLVETMKKKNNPWAIFWAVLAMLYFFVPMLGTFIFFAAHEARCVELSGLPIGAVDANFLRSFSLFRHPWGVVTVIVSVVLLLPTCIGSILKRPK